MTVPSRTPILVGVGVAPPAPSRLGASDEASELMATAVAAAAADAGGRGLLTAVERVAVPRGTWSYTDPGRLVAGRIGAAGAGTVLAEIGIPQQTLVNRVLADIAAGRLDVAVVVGGEAKQRAALAKRDGVAAPDTDQVGQRPDEHLVPEGEIIGAAEIKAGIWPPVQQYAIIDNALRHAEGVTVAGQLDEIARLWAAFNAVATTNPHAAFPTPRSESFLRRPGRENRPMAFPYAKWHSTQWTVNQAGALLLCSAEAALRHGVPRDRWVFPLVALESSYALTLSGRREMARWPAMRVLGAAAAGHLGRPLAEIDHVELYSCFPAAVRVQQRELGLPLDGVPTVTGGMAFAGGPFNNFTYQATAAVVERLRAGAGQLGLVTTVSGLLTKPGLMVWSTEPGPLLTGDLAGDAAAATARVEVTDNYEGPARVAGYTVTYDGLGPARVVVIADTADGRRCVAGRDDARLAEWSTKAELIGTPIEVTGGSFVGASSRQG